MSIKLKSSIKKIVGDLVTPVGLYLNLRDAYPNALLLESSDYNKKQGSYSYICLKSIASFKANADQVEIDIQGKSTIRHSLQEITLAVALHQFTQCLQVDYQEQEFTSQCLFGYTTYDAVPLHHAIDFRYEPIGVPLVHYQYFQFVLVFNHFKNELSVIENLVEGQESGLQELEEVMARKNSIHFPFETIAERESNYTDSEFKALIEKGKEHCFLGNVFQIVLSRRFSRAFKGDEFNVYRALRSINPSPYLFYFDYGSYKIMGSSPEAQITIRDQIATIHPIAGTFRRTGEAGRDEELVQALKMDPKENAEHVMLVDLARNDLSINSGKVSVSKYKSVEMYSHVIHMVSKVEAQLDDPYNAIEIFLNTFPAGTLSGAPKHSAMKLIDSMENSSRGFYGGAVGLIGLDGTFNHAIFIRSLLSKDQKLHYQAGCGVVARSIGESELQEVYNKLDAVESAIALAQKKVRS